MELSHRDLLTASAIMLMRPDLGSAWLALIVPFGLPPLLV